MAYGLLPERTHPPFVALAVKVDLGRLFEIEMLDTASATSWTRAPVL